MSKAGRCMVVDDQDDVRALVRLIIQAADAELTIGCEVANGLEALEVIDDCDPFVVILDEMMPGLNGLETARRIRQRRPDQRFVLFSAFVTPSLRQEAALEGIHICLSKNEFDLLPDAIRLACN